MLKNIFNLKSFTLSLSSSLLFYYSYKYNNEIKATESNLLTKTYIWGNGIYQAKPDGYVQFKNFEPKLIENFIGKDKPNMLKIYFGEHHEAGIDINGNAYLWNKHILNSNVEPQNSDNIRKGIQIIDDSKEAVNISFTKGFAWVLRKNGDVYQWPISVKYDEENEENKQVKLGEKRKVSSLKDIIQITTGEDHFIALNKEGEVLSMGDDTYGQCGLYSDGRNSGPPYFEKRVKKPEKINNLPKITKVVSGANHTLALGVDGLLYGWGSNSNMQLSHQMEFSQVENPLLASFTPMRLVEGLTDNTIKDIAAGKEFSIIVTENKISKETEVFGCGHNLHGELGTGFIKHVSDVVKIDSLSNYKIKTEKGEQDVTVKEIACGNNHCMALLSVGVILEWGANEYGQLGNKKRAYSENPLIVSNFTKNNVLSINCGLNNSAVIVENNENKV